MKEEKITFELDVEEVKRAKTWIAAQKQKHGSNTGTMGDRFGYQFIPTGLGVIKYCLDLGTGEKECLSDLTNW